MKFFASIAAISTKIKHDKINAFAAESALFIIMSFIPCLILLMLIVKYTPLTEELILNFVNSKAACGAIAELTGLSEAVS